MGIVKAMKEQYVYQYIGRAFTLFLIFFIAPLSVFALGSTLSIDGASGEVVAAGSSHSYTLAITGADIAHVEISITGGSDSFSNFSNVVCPTGWDSSIQANASPVTVTCDVGSGSSFASDSISFTAVAPNTEGTYAIAISATDSAGGTASTGNTLQIDGTNPVIASFDFSGVFPPVTTGDTLTISSTITDATAVSLESATLEELDLSGTVIATHDVKNELGQTLAKGQTTNTVTVPSLDSAVSDIRIAILVKDRAGLTATATTSSIMAEAPTPPVLDSAGTADTDNNGKIDTITLHFTSGGGSGAAFGGFGGGSPSGPILDTASFNTQNVSVDGYVVTAMTLAPGSTADIDVTVTELGSPNTGDLPATVTVSGITDDAGIAMATTTLTSTSGGIVDEASPRMVSATIALDNLSIDIAFSEDLNGTTINSTGTDFSIASTTISGADEVQPGVVRVTLATPLIASSTNIAVQAGSIFDLASNPVVSHSVTATQTVVPDTTPITIQSVTLSTSATSTDQVTAGDSVTLSFSLDEAAASTTVSILGSVVTPASTSTDYTAIYVVQSSDAPGPVTFSISVSDAAGNISSATATTDNSALTIASTTSATSTPPSSGNSGSSGGSGPSATSTIPYSIQLSAANRGFNLISLPTTPADTSIASVLSGIADSVTAVWSYDSSQPSGWAVYYPNNPDISTLSTMTAGYGYWVQVSKDVTLTGAGTVIASGASTPPSRTLVPGWNLVGYYQPDSTTTSTSVDSAFASIGTAGVAYTSIFKYDTSTGTFSAPTTIAPGDAVWIFVTGAGATLAPSNL